MSGDKAEKRRRAWGGHVPRLNVPFDHPGGAGVAAARLHRQGELEYRFTGELRFQAPLDAKGLPFHQRGPFRP